MARILVVDDDDSVRAAIATILEYAGHSVVPAHSGADGIAAMQREPADVALVDLMMPGMDGLETIRALRALAPMTPIIAISGFMMHSAAQEGEDYLTAALRHGATHNLQKPFRPHQLNSLIAACLPADGLA